MLRCLVFRLCYLLVLIVPLNHAFTSLSDDTLQLRLPKPKTSDFDIVNGPLLAPILIPRVPGTPGSTKVLNHFVDFFKKELPAWTITFQNSTSKTPTHGSQEVPFVNFIATRYPPWSGPGQTGLLTLVAHYDSKYTPTGFIGATDSAAPCAMIMHAVKSIDVAISKKWQEMQTNGYDPDFDEEQVRGVQVLFLDGEEAFQSWSDADSIYGARSLAEEWDRTMHPAMSTYKTLLNSIDLFVLLDLLGSPEDTPIPSWMQNTHWSYKNMADMEQRLRKLGLFKSNPERMWLNERDKGHNGVFRSYVMQDDHIPFVARGVPTLHLIPARFPSVWHTINDDAEHLDIPTVEDWALLTTAFAAEYLDLEGYFDVQPKLQARDNMPKDELSSHAMPVK